MRIATRLALFALLAVGGAAQVLVTGSVYTPANQRDSRLDNLELQGRFGIAFPPAPHVAAFWNMAGLSFDRMAGHNGGALESGLEAWLSPARQPVFSHAPLVLAEATVGRRWGVGLHGYTTLGAGLGWSLGDWVPYVELRRRNSFHSGRPVTHDIVIGIHFVVFG